MENNPITQNRDYLIIMHYSAVYADLFTISDFLCPGCLGPLFVYLGLLPCFAYNAAPGTVRKLYHKLCKMHLLETHCLALYSSARAINQSLQRVGIHTGDPTRASRVK